MPTSPTALGTSPLRQQVCIIRGAAHHARAWREEEEGEGRNGTRAGAAPTTTRRLAKDVYGGMLATEPCLNQPPVVGFAFDRLKGLPARCVDALGLCISSLTSTVETSKLLEMELIPPTQSHLGFENVTCGHVGECT